MDLLSTPVETPSTNPTKGMDSCPTTNKQSKPPRTDEGATINIISSGTVHDRIKLFDRTPPPPPPTLIEKRLEQLSNKWTQDATKKVVANTGLCGRTGKPVQPPKIEWYTSPSSGIYKKRLAPTCE